MDPKACLTQCSIALADRNLDLAREYLQAYSSWRANGGFEPMMIDTRGDQYLKTCVRKFYQLQGMGA